MKVDALERYLPRTPDEVPGRDTSFAYPTDRETVTISKFEREFGILTLRNYEANIKRLPSWKVLPAKVGGVTEKVILVRRDLAHTQTDLPVRDDRRPVAPEYHYEYVQLDTSGLANEQVPVPVLKTAKIFKFVEDRLSDYSTEAERCFRNIWGVSRSYHQWSDEEGTHSDGQAFILDAQGFVDIEAQEQDYYDYLEERYEPPTRDLIGVSCITAPQERMAGLNYGGLYRTCKDANAPVAAKVYGLTSSDESFHGKSYRGSIIIAHSLVPVRVKKTVIQTAAEFDMPALDMLRNRRRSLLDMVESGALKPDMLTEKTILFTLLEYPFIEPELAKEVADHHKDPEYIQRIKDWTNQEAA